MSSPSDGPVSDLLYATAAMARVHCKWKPEVYIGLCASVVQVYWYTLLCNFNRKLLSSCVTFIFWSDDACTIHTAKTMNNQLVPDSADLNQW